MPLDKTGKTQQFQQSEIRQRRHFGGVEEAFKLGFRFGDPSLLQQHRGLFAQFLRGTGVSGSPLACSRWRAVREDKQENEKTECFMEAYKTYLTVGAAGQVVLSDLPFQPGSCVEVQQSQTPDQLIG